MQGTIRAAGAGDASALSVVGGASFLETFPDSIPWDDMLAHIRNRHAESVYADWLADARTTCWLAEAPLGAPLGYAVLTEPDLPPDCSAAGDMELKRIYVLSVAQGSGTGARLMQAALAAAAGYGARRVLLGVYDQNVRAIAFYRRMGFVEVGVRTFIVGSQRYDDLVFAKAVGV